MHTSIDVYINTLHAYGSGNHHRDGEWRTMVSHIYFVCKNHMSVCAYFIYTFTPTLYTSLAWVHSWRISDGCYAVVTVRVYNPGPAGYVVGETSVSTTKEFS